MIKRRFETISNPTTTRPIKLGASRVWFMTLIDGLLVLWRDHGFIEYLRTCSGGGYGGGYGDVLIVWYWLDAAPSNGKITSGRVFLHQHELQPFLSLSFPILTPMTVDCREPQRWFGWPTTKVDAATMLSSTITCAGEDSLIRCQGREGMLLTVMVSLLPFCSGMK